MAKNTTGKPGESHQDTRLRQQAETALQIAYQKLNSHVENSPLAVIEWDSEFRVQRWSATAEKIFGWTAADVHGKRPEDWRFVYEEDEGYLRDRKNRLVRGEESPRQTVIHNRNYTKDGRLLACEWYNSELSDEAGKLTSLLSLVQDVTERMRIEEELRTLNTELEQRVNARTAQLQASEQRLRELAREQEQLLIASDRLVSLGELAASLAHEFNNPLGIAMGFAQDLLSEAQPTDPAYQRLQIIESQTRRCGQLLKDLSELARPPQAHRIPTDLAAIVRQSLNLVSGRLRENKIEAQLDLAANLDPVAIDPQQLEQVLPNVYFNAIEAMPDGGTLTVRVWKNQAAEEAAGEAREAGAGPDAGLPDAHSGYKEKSEVWIAVIDTGMGIAPEHRAKIFRPFFTTKRQRGMGLGLFICDSIMRAHAGHISIDSTPGQGTTVLLHFPRDTPIQSENRELA